MSQQQGFQYDLPADYNYGDMATGYWNVMSSDGQPMSQTQGQTFVQRQYGDPDHAAAYGPPASTAQNYGNSDMMDTYDHNSIDTNFGVAGQTTAALSNTFPPTPPRQDTPPDIYQSNGQQDGTTNSFSTSNVQNAAQPTAQGAWSGQFQTAEQAAQYLASLEEQLQPPKIHGDDSDWVSFMFMKDLAGDFFKAISHPFGSPPTDWDAIKIGYYDKQQRAAADKITAMLATFQGYATAEARMVMAVQEGINVHLIGVPASHFARKKRGDRSGYRTDFNLICSARLEAMKSGIAQNKLIAWDVLNGQGLTEFARNPAEYLDRKLVNVKSNGNKKEGEKLFQKQKNKMAQEQGFGHNTSDNTSEGQAQFTSQAGDMASSFSSTSTRKNGKKRKVDDSDSEMQIFPDSRPTKQQRMDTEQEDPTPFPAVNNMYEDLTMDDQEVQIGQPYYLNPAPHAYGSPSAGLPDYSEPFSSVI